MSLIFIWKENLKPANFHLQTVNPENTMTKRYFTKRVWRYQSGNQNSYIEEEQTTHWSKENVQKDKQRSTKHTYKTKDRVTRTPLKTAGELRGSVKLSSSFSASGTRRVTLVANPVISHEWRKQVLNHQNDPQAVKQQTIRWQKIQYKMCISMFSG
jgi:hypothetical protein